MAQGQCLRGTAAEKGLGHCMSYEGRGLWESPGGVSGMSQVHEELMSDTRPCLLAVPGKVSEAATVPASTAF